MFMVRFIRRLMDIDPLSEDEAMSNIADEDTLRDTLQKAWWAFLIILEHPTQAGRQAEYARRPRLFCLKDGTLRELIEEVLTPEVRLTRYSIYASNEEQAKQDGKLIKVNFR